MEIRIINKTNIKHIANIGFIPCIGDKIVLKNYGVDEVYVVNDIYHVPEDNSMVVIVVFANEDAMIEKIKTMDWNDLPVQGCTSTFKPYVPKIPNVPYNE